MLPLSPEARPPSTYLQRCSAGGTTIDNLIGISKCVPDLFLSQ